MMDTLELLKIFNRHRGDAIVVPGRGGKYWVNISTKPNRDLPLGDPAMGGHASFARASLRAQPKQKIVRFVRRRPPDGVGSLATTRHTAE